MTDYQLALELGRDAMRSGDYFGASGRYHADLTNEQRAVRAMEDSEAIMEDVRSGRIDPTQYPELGHAALVVGVAVGQRFDPRFAAREVQQYQELYERAAPAAPMFR